MCGLFAGEEYEIITLWRIGVFVRGLEQVWCRVSAAHDITQKLQSIPTKNDNYELHSKSKMNYNYDHDARSFIDRRGSTSGRLAHIIPKTVLVSGKELY